MGKLEIKFLLKQITLDLAFWKSNFKKRQMRIYVYVGIAKSGSETQEP